MSRQHPSIRSAPIGLVQELPTIEAGAVIYFRLWCAGPEARGRIRADLYRALGPTLAESAFLALENLCETCTRLCRRPLARHDVRCEFLCSDEACFGRLVAEAAQGEREDALMMATLMVRADVAPIVVALGAEFGQVLMRIARMPADAPPGTPLTLH